MPSRPVWRDLYVAFALLAPAISSEAVWVMVWGKVSPKVSQRGLATFKLVVRAVSLYTVLYCVSALVYIFLLHGNERKLLPPAAIYGLMATHLLLLGATARVYEYFVTHFPKR
jgi:hypothetical protein